MNYFPVRSAFPSSKKTTTALTDLIVPETKNKSPFADMRNCSLLLNGMVIDTELLIALSAENMAEKSPAVLVPIFLSNGSFHFTFIPINDRSRFALFTNGDASLYISSMIWVGVGVVKDGSEGGGGMAMSCSIIGGALVAFGSTSGAIGGVTIFGAATDDTKSEAGEVGWFSFLACPCKYKAALRHKHTAPAKKNQTEEIL